MPDTALAQSIEKTARMPDCGVLFHLDHRPHMTGKDLATSMMISDNSALILRSEYLGGATINADSMILPQRFPHV